MPVRRLLEDAWAERALLPPVAPMGWWLPVPVPSPEPGEAWAKEEHLARSDASEEWLLPEMPRVEQVKKVARAHRVSSAGS